MAGCKWLLLSHPKHLIFYVSQELLEQHGIFQVFTTYVDRLMKGVVSEKSNAGLFIVQDTLYYKQEFTIS